MGHGTPWLWEVSGLQPFSGYSTLTLVPFSSWGFEGWNLNCFQITPFLWTEVTIGFWAISLPSCSQTQQSPDPRVERPEASGFLEMTWPSSVATTVENWFLREPQSRPIPVGIQEFSGRQTVGGTVMSLAFPNLNLSLAWLPAGCVNVFIYLSCLSLGFFICKWGGSYVPHRVL